MTASPAASTLTAAETHSENERSYQFDFDQAISDPFRKLINHKYKPKHSFYD
jgi:hypothetical protein